MTTIQRGKVRLGRHQEPMGHDQVQTTIRKLESAIQDIYGKKESQLSFEDLYRSAYTLVLQKHGLTLYESVKSCFEQHLNDQKRKLKRVPDEKLLEALGEIWKDHLRALNVIKDFLMYLDKAWVPQQNAQLSVYDQGNSLFLSCIIRDGGLYSRIITSILDRMSRHRNNELVDLSPVQTAYAMLQRLDEKREVVYELFEKDVLEATEKHYSRVSSAILEDSTADVYLRFVEGKLREEKKMAGTFFPDMEPKLNAILQREMLSKHAQRIIDMPNSGFLPMIKESKHDDLRLLFTLLTDAHSHSIVECARIFGEHISKTGLTIIQAPVSESTPVQPDSVTPKAGADTMPTATSSAEAQGGAELAGAGAGSVSSVSQIAVTVVLGLIEEKQKYDAIVKICFRGDKLFQKTVKEAFEYCMNLDAKCAQYLAVYCDELLTGKLAESKNNMDEVLDKVIGIFRFLSDKDVFEAYYKQHLSKRLLGQRSVSEDAEKIMIAKLKSECGSQFTSKFEGMFKDMALSQDASNDFKTSLIQKGVHTPIEFSASVLANGFWPSSVHYQDGESVKLPPPLASLKESFETFYFANHTGRRLTWNYALGTCEVKVTGFSDNGAHEFVVTPLQCIIMLAFNNSRRKITFADLLKDTGIPRNDLKRHLISMAVPKFQMFNKTGPKREFLDEDLYEFNVAFKSKLRKIKIPLVSMSTNSSSSAKTEELEGIGIPEAVMESRKHIVEATIVRVMKSRKRMEHNNLMAEVFKQLRFKPTPQDIKKRVESLIERECKFYVKIEGRRELTR